LILSVLLGLCAWAQAVSAEDRSTPSAAEIIQRSVQANQADWAQEPQYDYFERDRTGTHTKTYQVTMLAGSPYSRLVAVDGQPLNAEEQAAEEQKFEKAKSEREQETLGQRQKRIAAYERERTRDQLMMDQLVKAFQFQLLGEQKLGPYDVYVLRATPRPGYRPPNRDTQVLTGMQGMLWIDRNTCQWVKVRARVVHPVSIEGFLAKVEPGTRFELEKMPVGPGVWLPKHFAMRAKAKIVGVFNHNSQEDDTYFNYHKSTGTGSGAQESRVFAGTGH